TEAELDVLRQQYAEQQAQAATSAEATAEAETEEDKSLLDRADWPLLETGEQDWNIHAGLHVRQPSRERGFPGANVAFDGDVCIRGFHGAVSRR
ncbi:MAG: hypothetical protein ACPG08_04135, partial [Flavobacteriales bacterium]